MGERRRERELRRFRQASSVKLPLVVGVVLFAMLAVLTGLLVGRTQDPVDVPLSLRDAYETAARDSAQSVRRSVNEGVDDLEAVARILQGGDRFGKPALDRALAALRGVHVRYLSLYVIDTDRRVLARQGGQPRPNLLDTSDPFRAAGMDDAKEVDGEIVIQQYAPIQTPNGRLALVGHYDPAFLQTHLESFTPGSGWVVNRDGKIIAALGGFLAFEGLPRRPLREAADLAADGQTGTLEVTGSSDRSEVVSFSAVSGHGPAGRLGWSVIGARGVPTIALPQVNVRTHGIIVGFAVGLLTLVVFGWLWLNIVQPLDRLEAEADRIADGDLSNPVQVPRYDEIGLVGRALERCRVALIRSRTSDGDTQDS